MDTQLHVFYERYRESEERWQERENLIRVNKILSLIPSDKKLKVLDLGCYTGVVLDELKKKGHEVIGAELSEYGINECKRKEIPVLKYDLNVYPYPFKSESYDVIICAEVIEHLIVPDLILNEIRRILKKDGILILTTPNLAALTRRIKLLLGRNPNIDVSLENSSGHVRYYTFSSIIGLLNKYKFKIDKQESDFILLKRFRFPKLVNAFKTCGWTIIIKARK